MTFSWVHLRSLLCRANKLKILKLTKGGRLERIPCRGLQEIPLADIAPEHIEELSIEETAIDEDILIGFLSKATRLKKLNLSNCGRLFPRLSEAVSALSNVEDLRLKGIEMSASQLVSILSHAKQLKTLTLENLTLDEPIISTLPLFKHIQTLMNPLIFYLYKIYRNCEFTKQPRVPSHDLWVAS